MKILYFLKKQLDHRTALFVAFLVMLGFGSNAGAQQKINDGTVAGTKINANAIQEYQTTNKGLLLPRLALTSTTAPAPLAAHVAGMYVYNTNTGGDVSPGVYYNDGAKWVRLGGAANSNSWYKATAATGAINTDNQYVTGSVGIGNFAGSAPRQKLDVNGNIVTDWADRIIGTQFLDGSQYSLGIRTFTASRITDLYSKVNDASGGVTISTGNTATEKVRVTAAGNVGIGTTAPSARLVVQAPDTARLASTPTNTALRLKMPGVSGAKYDVSADFRIGSYATSGTQAQSRLNILLGNGNTGTPEANIMSLLGNGNVGIGDFSASNPLAKLDIKGNILLRDGGSYWNFSAPQIDFGWSGSENCRQAIRSRHTNTSSAGNAIEFYTWQFGVDEITAPPTQFVMSINGSNVGIGTHDPLFKLHVAGNIGAFSYNCLSDRRLKHAIADFTTATDKVLKIRPVTYVLNQDPTQTTEIGVVAQELEELFPELVTTGADGYKSVKYDRISILLLTALQQQTEKLNKQENLLLQVTTELDEMKKEIRLLKENSSKKKSH